jgi:hypothetical protein
MRMLLKLLVGALYFNVVGAALETFGCPKPDEAPVEISGT